jgi:serine/threonine protein kinase
MVNCRHTGEETIVEQVQIIDLENAAHLPKGRCIKGMLAGNDNWRSPEAHFKGELNKPTDIFSFGIVVSASTLLETTFANLRRYCIYAMLGRVIFGTDDDVHKHQAQGALPALIRLQRRVSYFGDQEGVNGLLKHITDDDTNCQVLRMLWEERSEEHITYKPFSQWPDAGDAMFKNFIRGLTNLDPKKRASAHQALEHPWLSDF